MNVFNFPNEKLPDELIEILLEQNNVRIEKIVSDGHTSNWYDQSEDEWVCLLKGKADIQFEYETKTLCAGDTLFIPKHQKHKVSRTTRCIWLCVFIGDDKYQNT